MDTRIPIAVIGAGFIGRVHAERIRASQRAELSGIVDPSDAGRDYARAMGCAHFDSTDDLLASAASAAAIIATPNQTHLPVALTLLSAGIPVLIEKPIAGTVEHGIEIARLASEKGVPVLVGHHRRHNPIVRRAKEIISQGTLGRLTSIALLEHVYKPPEYFDLTWRTKKGAGPVLLNLIHEIDLVRHLCGEIAAVQAFTSNAVRGFEVEDTSAILLKLESGALVTISQSDTAVSPWSWPIASAETPGFTLPSEPVSTHFISGTKGSLTLPGLEVWSYGGTPNWTRPISKQARAIDPSEVYGAQLDHFCRVATGRELPLVGADDAVRTLRATLAVHEAAATAAEVRLARL